MALINNALSYADAYDIGAEWFEEEYLTIINTINKKAEELDLSPVSVERLHPLLEETIEDFKNQLQELEAETVKPDDIIIRAGLTAWLITHVLAGQVTIEVAEQSDVELIAWVTSGDTKVCDICEANEGTHPLNELLEFPAHVACRCWLELIR